MNPTENPTETDPHRGDRFIGKWIEPKRNRNGFGSPTHPNQTCGVYLPPQEAGPARSTVRPGSEANRTEKENPIMYASFYKRGKYACVQDVRSNFVCIRDNELVATVFAPNFEPWRVVIHYHQPPARYSEAFILKNEGFPDPQAAMTRAEEFLEDWAIGLSPLNGKFANVFLHS
jgi:hypothetical protein